MSIYISPEEVAKAKQMDLFTYLKRMQPDELVHKGNNHYTTKSHDSLDISNGFWKRWSTGDGGKTAVDYLIKVEKLSLQEAVQSVIGMKGFKTWDVRPKGSSAPMKQAFVLPEKNFDNTKAIQYLKSRGIHSDVIDYCIQNKCLYEEKNHHNVVFVGHENGQAKYAFRRGTCGIDFKREAAGSDKKYGFCIAENKDATVLHVYECAIDLLSYCSMGRLVNGNWKQDFHLSQGGVSSGANSANIGVALEEFLTNHPSIQKVYLRYDNDKTGYEAAIATQRVLQQKYSIEAEIKLPKQGKDYNEYLQGILQKLQNNKQPPFVSPSLQVSQNKDNKRFVKQQGVAR